VCSVEGEKENYLLVGVDDPDETARHINGHAATSPTAFVDRAAADLARVLDPA
jgi:hypothetical protein